jgi:hypothetical protein
VGIPDRLLLFLRRTTLEIAAAAAEVLDEHDQELLAAVFAVHKSLEAQRNDLAHGLFGVADQISDGLLWVEIKHQAPWTMDRISRWDATPSPGVIEHVYVYKAKALIDLHNEIATFGQNTMALATYYRTRLTNPTDPQLDELYRELCSEPHTAQALSDLRNRKNKTEARS